MKRDTKSMPRWYFKPDGKGAFDVYHHDQARIESNKADPELAKLIPKYPGLIADSQVLTGVTEDEAKAHVSMATANEVERDAHHALAAPHFNQKNWKMPTTRIVYNDEEAANKVADALAYFLGGSEVKPVTVENAVNAKDGKGWLVGSLGYYHYVGA